MQGTPIVRFVLSILGILISGVAAAQGIPVQGGGSLTNVRNQVDIDCSGGGTDTVSEFFGWVYFNSNQEFGSPSGGVLWNSFNCNTRQQDPPVTTVVTIPTFLRNSCTIAFTIFDANETSAVLTCVPLLSFTIPTHRVVDPPFPVGGTSDSPGLLTYALESGPAMLSPAGLVTLTGTSGTVVVNVSQAASPPFTAGSSIASFDVVSGSVWSGNDNSSLSIYAIDGAPQANVAGGGLGLIGMPLSAAFDQNENLWVASSAGVSAFTQTGVPLQSSAITGGGIANPVSLAIDGAGLVWIANANETVSVLNPAGTPVTPSGGFLTPTTGSAGSLAIDISGSVWISNQTTGTVTQIVGAATPAAPPSSALTNGTTGVAP